ncbi:hypothetical protein FLP41_05925 [Paracoccus marcusii]|uniref:hypothetical protein n=1 Tax=Paracoccus marcusii TaxID=59779 RepID=UPI002ED1359E|nr:hypothetical protein FLP41_05925 [Paracoccus marcusii]
MGKAVLDAAADHHLDQAVDGDVGDIGAADIFAVAQHGDAVADLEDLVQVV